MFVPSVPIHSVHWFGSCTVISPRLIERDDASEALLMLGVDMYAAKEYSKSLGRSWKRWAALRCSIHYREAVSVSGPR